MVQRRKNSQDETSAVRPGVRQQTKRGEQRARCGCCFGLGEDLSAGLKVKMSGVGTYRCRHEENDLVSWWDNWLAGCWCTGFVKNLQRQTQLFDIFDATGTTVSWALGGEEDGDGGNSQDGTANGQKATTAEGSGGGGGGGGGRATRFGDFLFLKADSQFAFKVGETASRLVKRGHPRKVFLRILGGRELTTELES